MEVVQGKIGPETTYDVKIEDGKLLADFDFKGAQAGATLHGYVDAAAVVLALKNHVADKIPGKVDDMVFDLIIASLKSQTPA